MSTADDFKPGDRVKVEYEAVVVERAQGDWIGVHHPYRPDCRAVFVHVATVTRLADPEPQWRQGDVIRIGFLTEPDTAMRFHTGWLTSLGNDLSDDQVNSYWRAGQVTVLHQAVVPR